MFRGIIKIRTTTNEDGFIIYTNDNLDVLSILMDSHTSYESVLLLTQAIEKKELLLQEYLKLPVKEAFVKVPQFFKDLLSSSTFIDQSKKITGETAVLIVLQKEQYIWWLSVGDNSLYLLHPEFSELGQYRLNQRIFYQWIGNRNSFDLDVPCFNEGTIELRQGENKVVMLTDGILGFGERLFEDSSILCDLFNSHSQADAQKEILQKVKADFGRDSSTIISWSIKNDSDGLRPSRFCNE